MILMVKDGRIGDIVSVDSTCTSLAAGRALANPWAWNSSCAWGPTALLPVVQILGPNDSDARKTSFFIRKGFDSFTRFDLFYKRAVATAKVGKGVKSEGELVISGTKGYIYVPAPWWKMDYFEVRYENTAENRRCFYPLEGEGIRAELVAFARSVTSGEKIVDRVGDCSQAICGLMHA